MKEAVQRFLEDVLGTNLLAMHLVVQLTLISGTYYNSLFHLVTFLQYYIIFSQKFCLKAENISTNDSFYHLLKEYLPKDKTEINIKVIESHGDSVIVKPTDSVLLGTSATCENEILLHGKHGNLLSTQSHPEFEYKYAVEERIWKFVVEKNKRVSPEDAALALESFQDYEQPHDLIEIIKNFLHC